MTMYIISYDNSCKVNNRMDYQDYVVQVLCCNSCFLESTIYDGFLYDLNCEYIITSGHAAGYKNYIILMKDGKPRRASICKVGSIDAMILKLDVPYRPYPVRTRQSMPHSLLQDINPGDSIVIANYAGPITVQVRHTQTGCIYTTKNGYPGAPVFTGNQLVGIVRGNGDNILPSAFIDKYLNE